jgi:hypothetical protein
VLGDDSAILQEEISPDQTSSNFFENSFLQTVIDFEG